MNNLLFIVIKALNEGIRPTPIPAPADMIEGILGAEYLKPSKINSNAPPNHTRIMISSNNSTNFTINPTSPCRRSYILLKYHWLLNFIARFTLIPCLAAGILPNH